MSVLPVTGGLVLDLKAAALTPSFGGVIGGWPDTSPARNIGYLIDTLPTWHALQTPAGGPAVRFAGQSQLRYDPILQTGTTNPFAQATGGAEIFAVIRATAGVTGNPGFYTAGGRDYGFYPAAAGSTASFDDGYRAAGVDGAVVDGSFTAHLYTIGGIDTAAWHVYNVYHDGGERVTSVDGVVVHRTGDAYLAPGALLVGAGLHGWSGDIAEFCAYQRALTAAERQQVLAFLTDAHFTAHPPDPNDPGTTPVTPGPAGLTLMSTVVDAFDGATLDPVWYSPGDQYALGGGHLRLDGVLQTASSGYNIDSAFVKAQFGALAAGDNGYLSFYASIPFGSPPANWGINIHVADGGPSEISATWTNDDGTSDSSATITYDPVAHAYLRLSSALAQLGGDWYLTMICEAGPAPGQWTTLLHSPQIYCSTVADGFQIVFQGQLQPQVYLSNFNVGAATSLLWMRMPDGAYRKAGVAGQPFSLRMPDGSMRTWPGAGLPLYMKMPDGSWRQILS